MPFGVVSEVGRGIGVLDWSMCLTGREVFWGERFTPIGLNGVFLTELFESCVES